MNHKFYLNKVSYICLYVSDVDESVKFYRDILGIEPTNSTTNPKNSTFYSFNTGETTLAIEPGGVRKNDLKTKAENPILLQFTADSQQQIEGITKYLEEHGVKIFDRVKKTDYGMITNFCDPDGNKLEIIYS